MIINTIPQPFIPDIGNSRNSYISSCQDAADD